MLHAAAVIMNLDTGLCLFAVIISSALCGGEVLVLDKGNFDDNIRTLGVMVVDFYAPWCGHCKALEPEFELAAKVLKEENPPIVLAKVDCDANIEICKRFNIPGFPMIKIFKDGQLLENYPWPREAKPIIRYMKLHYTIKRKRKQISSAAEVCARKIVSPFIIDQAMQQDEAESH